MTRTHIALLALLILVGTFFALMSVRQTAVIPATDVDKSRTADSDQPAQNTPSISAASKNANQQVRQPLPPSGTPINTVYDSLISRGKNGDAAAAMRLYRDLSQCAVRKAKYEQVARLAFPGQSDVDASGVARPDIVNQNLHALDASDALCKDIPDSAIASRGGQLLQAALDGDTSAMVCYSMSTQDRGPPFLSNQWFDYADQWAREAPFFAQKAFNAGQSDVIPLLIDAYTPNSPATMKNYQFSELTAPDARTAYGLALLYQRVAPTSSAEAASNMVADLGKALSAEDRQWGDSFSTSNFPRFASNAGDAANAAPCFGGQ